jgi:hypothetical protein
MQSNEHKKEVVRTPITGTVFDDGRIVELVYDPVEKKTSFAVGEGTDVSYCSELTGTDTTVYVPTSPHNNLVKHNVVMLPSQAEPYESVEALIEAIVSYIHRYVHLSPDFEIVAAHYVLLTWVYDAFNEVPYLRFRGDYGTGKTRALLVLGSICYKGIFASGASTVSPIFHILDAFSGTLIFDEADFRFSDEKAELSKILNNGNVRGFPVLRTTMNLRKEFDPRAFQVYGPKLVGMRGSYDDRALESRFLTEDMGTWGLRKEIPINLPDSQKDEALHLRNMLLSYRLHNRHTVAITQDALQGIGEARLRQVLTPLASLMTSEQARKSLFALAHTADQTITLDRSESREAELFGVITELFRDGSVDAVPIAAITERFRQVYGAQYVRPITNRWIGSLIRIHLHMKSYKRHGVYVLPWMGDTRFAELSARFSCDIPGDELQA